jgi:hypothetical protein
VAFQLALDRSSGVGRERHAALRIEAVDGLDQTDHRDLAKVVVVAAAGVPSGDVGGQSHVHLDQLVAQLARSRSPVLDEAFDVFVLSRHRGRLTTRSWTS